MLRILREFGRSLRVRSTIQSAINNSDPGAIRSLLAQSPDTDEFIAKQAIAFHQTGAPWPSLILCVGLAESDSSRGMEVLRCLLEGDNSKPAGPDHLAWSRLHDEQAAALVCFVEQYGSWRDLALLYAHFTDNLLKSLQPPETGPAHCIWTLTALLRGVVSAAGADSMLDYRRPDHCCLLGAGADEADIREHFLETACRMLRRPANEDPDPRAIATVCFLSRLRDVPAPEDVLDGLVSGLPRLDDARLADVCNLLARHPSARWVEDLRDEWLALEDRFGCSNQESVHDSMEAHEAAVVHAVATALARCGVCDPDFRNFDDDRKTAHGLPDLIERGRRLASEHDRLVKEFKRERLTGQESHRNKIERISELQRELVRIEQAGNEERQRHRGKLSPAFLFWCVLRDGRRYPVAMRQSAAWGLHLFCEEGQLDTAASDSIKEVIRSAVQSEDDHGFCERIVYALPEQGVLGLTQSLREGLEWMVRIADGAYCENNGHAADADGQSSAPGSDADGEDPLDAFGSLGLAVWLMCRKMPEALSFLEQHALRLMRLDDHRQVLGRYTVAGCGLDLWTDYEPPQYVGVVAKRYLRFCDRSKPNSMGVYYRLFCNPALVLPVIYHEHLHYGGPAGDPQQGIGNESEVLLREIIFARQLIAELADRLSDDALPEFEASIVRMIRFAGTPSLLHQWLSDLRDDAVWSGISRSIAATYGSPMESDVLDRAAAFYLELRNLDIELANLVVEHQGWYPEIRWPLLDEPEASEQRAELERTVRERWSRAHQADAARRDEILREPDVSEAIRRWEGYCQRPNALRGLQAALQEAKVSQAEESELIVRRFPFQPLHPHAEHARNAVQECKTWLVALESFERQLAPALEAQQNEQIIEVSLGVQQLCLEMHNTGSRLERVAAAARQFGDVQTAQSLSDAQERLTATFQRVLQRIPDYVSKRLELPGLLSEMEVHRRTSRGPSDPKCVSMNHEARGG